MKDYLEHEGFNLKSPRETIRQAYQTEVITNADIWIAALNNRNLTVHTYDKERKNSILNFIANDFKKEVLQLKNFFCNKIK
jgi:nucleotidyltransferase substrate binding protein (TIGR01987 family)